MLSNRSNCYVVDRNRRFFPLALSSLQWISPSSFHGWFISFWAIRMIKMLFHKSYLNYPTWTVDESRFSGSSAESRAVTTKLYIGIVSRSSMRCVRIVPFCRIIKSLLSSPAVMLYSMRPLLPIKIHRKIKLEKQIELVVLCFGYFPLEN